MDLSKIPLYKVLEENKKEDRIYSTSIPGLYYIDTIIHEDERGFYREIAVLPDLDKARQEKFEVKQLNHSNSKQNVVRGIHAEDWNKLITVTQGVCLCVLSDIKPDSPTFLQKEYFLLGYGKNEPLPGSIFVTKGIGNAFITVEGPSEYIYAVDKLYRDRDKSGDVAISLFDPGLDIKWPIEQDQMIFSDRDKNFTTLRKLYPNKF
jgi:dTDP-4-dehydrorhamnose 3,5-epimerase-like enzyme